MNTRFLRRTGLALALSPAFVLGCSSSTPDESVSPALAGANDAPAVSAAATPEGLQELGSFRGHWSGGRMQYTALDAKSAASGIRPQGFINVPDTATGFETTEAIAYDPTCGGGEDPEAGWYGEPRDEPPTLSTGEACEAGYLCAYVKMMNLSARDLDTAYVQVTRIFGAVGEGVAAGPTGYPLDASKGLWAYGNVGAGATSDAVRWNFKMAAGCPDFHFDFKVMGTVKRTGYNTSSLAIAATGPAAGDTDSWIDACALGSHTTILENAAAGTHVDDIPMPFPFTLYDTTADTDVQPILSINASGALGFFSAAMSGSNVSLPDNTGSYDYSLFAYWDNVKTTSSGVCYGTTGSAPNRKFVVTWKNADIADTAAQENLTFSAILQEGSDRVVYYYDRWSAGQNDCSAPLSLTTGGRVRGNGATVGVQGTDLGDGTVATQASYNTAFLPCHTAACPGTRFKRVLSPTLGNTF